MMMMMMIAIMMMIGDENDDFGHPLGLNICLRCSGPPTLPMCYAKQLKSLVEFKEFQTLQSLTLCIQINGSLCTMHSINVLCKAA